MDLVISSFFFISIESYLLLLARDVGSGLAEVHWLSSFAASKAGASWLINIFICLFSNYPARLKSRPFPFSSFVGVVAFSAGP
jgi:hypothetical protein